MAWSYRIDCDCPRCNKIRQGTDWPLIFLLLTLVVGVVVGVYTYQ